MLGKKCLKLFDSIKLKIRCLGKHPYHGRAVDPKKLKTAEQCFDAVRQDGWMLKFVPAKLKTPELCFEAMKGIMRAGEYIPKRLKQTITRLKKMDFEDQSDKLTKYSIIMQEIMAMYIYNENFIRGDLFRITSPRLLNYILSERRNKLNSNFEWTDENKQKFLNVNDKLLLAFERAYKEALSVAEKLENRIKNNDDFFAGL